MCRETEMPRNGLRPLPLLGNTESAKTDRQKTEINPRFDDHARPDGDGKTCRDRA
jgi:hypothetical protein